MEAERPVARVVGDRLAGQRSLGVCSRDRVTAAQLRHGLTDCFAWGKAECSKPSAFQERNRAL